MKRIVTIALGVTIALLVAAAPAVAASGTTAGFAAGSGFCWDSKDWGGSGKGILATAPSITPAETPYGTGGGQVVGFRATLQRWNPYTASWAASQYSPLKTQTTSRGFVSEDWYDSRTGSPVAGTHQFPITTGGYYRVVYDYYWYRNGLVSGHDASLAWGMRDDRLSAVGTTGYRYVDWCLY
jgi:hypothetical protein